MGYRSRVSSISLGGAGRTAFVKSFDRNDAKGATVEVRQENFGQEN